MTSPPSLPLPHTRADQPFITCVVPGLNEHDNLVLLLPVLTELMNQISRRWEIIVVDDGSTDRTPELMAAYAQNPGFRYLQLSRNFGKEAALSAGLDAAAGHMRDRAATYDKPEGERSMGKTVAIFNQFHGTALTEAQGWHMLQILKDVRLFANPQQPHRDSVEDCVAYAALKGEAFLKGGAQ